MLDEQADRDLIGTESTKIESGYIFFLEKDFPIRGKILKGGG